jgi:hypothetical protein
LVGLSRLLTQYDLLGVLIGQQPTDTITVIASGNQSQEKTVQASEGGMTAPAVDGATFTKGK